MSVYDYPVFEPKRQGRLTILICTPDSQSPRFVRCYKSLCSTTRGMAYDLMIYDNRRNLEFSHQTEINRALDISPGPLLTMDDDVVLSGDWLPAMLAQLGPGVGIISPSSTDTMGRIRSRGATFRRNGSAALFRGDIKAPIYVPCVGSCCSLINTAALAGMRYSHEYKKYCFDPDMSFRLWERGLSTVVIPEKIIHDSGGTMRDLGIDREPYMRHDEEVFRKKWIDSGRLDELYERHAHLWPEGLQKIL